MRRILKGSIGRTIRQLNNQFCTVFRNTVQFLHEWQWMVQVLQQVACLEFVEKSIVMDKNIPVMPVSVDYLK